MDHITIIKKSGKDDIASILEEYQTRFPGCISSEKLEELKKYFTSQEGDLTEEEISATVITFEGRGDQDSLIEVVKESGMRFATPLELLLFAKQCKNPEQYIQKNRDVRIYTFQNQKMSYLPGLCWPITVKGQEHVFGTGLIPIHYFKGICFGGKDWPFLMVLPKQ